MKLEEKLHRALLQSNFDLPRNLCAKLAHIAEAHYSPNTTSPILVEEIYKAYPRKIGSKAAKLKIRNACKEIDPAKLLEITKIYAESCKGQDKQYIPHPATWYGQGRYEDDQSEWTASTQDTPKLSLMDMKRIGVISGELDALREYQQLSEDAIEHRQNLRTELAELNKRKSNYVKENNGL